MQIRNNRGSSTEPCGTPEFVGTNVELLSFTVTDCDRLVRKHSNQGKIFKSILGRLRLYSNSLWDTLSNAFEKSRNMQSLRDPWSSVERMLWVKTKSWVLHENYLVNPC